MCHDTFYFYFYNMNFNTHAHRIKISNRRATQRCNVSSFFYAKICSLLAKRRSSKPVQRVYWPENVIDGLEKWRPTCLMRHARGQKLQSFRRACTCPWKNFCIVLHGPPSWLHLTFGDPLRQLCWKIVTHPPIPPPPLYFMTGP